jgi:hypothetical protein
MAITADRLSPLSRRLIPSLADLLFVALLVTQAQPSLFSDADTGWHLWSGNQVLAHGPGPVPDTFSYSRAGASWQSPQWLGEAVLARVYRSGGWTALALFCSGLFAATLAWAYRRAFTRAQHVPWAMTVTLLAALVTWPHVLARPVVFAYPLFLAALAVTQREKPGALAAGALAALAALWANVHPSAPLAAAVAGLAWLSRPRERWLAIGAGLALLALGATPSGFGWLAGMLPTGDNRILFAGIDEWKSPQFREPRYWALLLAILFALGARSRGGSLAPGERAGGLLGLAAALVAARFAPFALLAWSPRLAQDLAGPPDVRPGGLFCEIDRTTRPFERVLRPGLWSLAIGAAALWLAPSLARWMPEVARGFPERDFPVAALAEAERLELGPKALTTYGWGGWLGFASHGRTRVFIDGRAGFYSGPVLRDYLALSRLRPDWQHALARAAPDWMLLPRDLPLVTAAATTGRWRVAWSDSTSAILLPAR